MDRHKASSGGDEPALDEFFSKLPPVLPPTHSRFPSTPSKAFLDATAGAQPIDIAAYDSEEAERSLEFVERLSGTS